MTGRLARTGCLVLGVLGALSVLISPSPAFADEDDGSDTPRRVPEGCILTEDDIGGLNDHEFIAGGRSYMLCEDSVDNRDCKRADNSHLQRRWRCTDRRSYEFRECRNDVRFEWLGFLSDDDEVATDARDDWGWIPLPSEATVSDLPEHEQWWFQEFEAEDALANDFWGFEGGQSCEVARNRPVHSTCEQVHERKERLRGVVEPALAREAETREHESVAFTDREQAAIDEMAELESIGGIVPDDCWGTYPSDRYQLTWHSEEDSDLLGNSNRVMGWAATVIYGLAKTAVVITLWLVRLAFTFDINEYRAAVGDFAESVDVNLVHLGGGQLSLFTVAWFALFAYAGYNALRGRMGRAAGEVLMVVLAAAVGMALIGDFFPHREGGSFRSSVAADQPAYAEDGYFDSAGNLLNLSALAMLAVANGDDPNFSAEDLTRGEVEELIGETNGALHHEFIERPYYFINYGQETFEAEAVQRVDGARVEAIPEDMDYQAVSCMDVIQNLLAVPDASGTWAQRYMERNGCEELAEWNGTMTAQRLMNVVVVAVVAGFVSVTIGLAAVTLLLAKFLLALVFVALPVAVVMALLPGRARSLAFGWGTTLLQLWLVTLAMGLVLALLLMGVDVITVTTEGQPLLERYLMLVALAITLFLLRRRLVAGAQGAARSLQGRLTGLTGDKGGQGSSLNSMDLTAVGRGGRRMGLGTKVALVAGGAMAMRAGVRTTRAVHHKTSGALYRTGRAELTRRHSARLGQGWHQRNTEHSRRAGQAGKILTGDGESREQMARASLGDGAMDRHGERKADAAAASLDAAALSPLLAGRGNKLTGDQEKALNRFGMTAAQFRSAGAFGRKAMWNDVQAKREELVGRAGGQRMVDTEARDAGSRQRQSWNAAGGAQPTYEDRAVRRDGADTAAGVAPTAARDKLAELDSAGILSRAEARATLADQPRGSV